MDNALKTLGQRILFAANMATWAHLALESDEAGGRSEAPGGAGNRLSADGNSSPADGCAPCASAFAERKAK
jgi:hypothetical protein